MKRHDADLQAISRDIPELFAGEGCDPFVTLVNEGLRRPNPVGWGQVAARAHLPL